MFKKKTKTRRKWCLPATCGMCKRTCTHFWGEVADHWACEGHYHIMQTNDESWGFKHYPEYQAISKLLEKYELPITDEDRDEIKATEEYENWYKGPVYKKWIEKRRAGAKWLKDNPEPEQKPTCSLCDQEALCHDKEMFFCMDHWPMEPVPTLSKDELRRRRRVAKKIKQNRKKNAKMRKHENPTSSDSV